MIFIICTGNKIDNEALVKQAADLTRKKFSFFERRTYYKSLSDSKRGEIFTSIDTTRPISRLKPDETLYVVGHGDPDVPRLSGLKPRDLADLLKSHGLNPNTRNLKINLVCCHSGHKTNRLSLSYAEQLYFILLDSIHELVRHHMEKEGSLLKLKAPKNLIGFRQTDGKAIGIKPKDYEAYRYTEAHSPDQLDNWLKEHVTELSSIDYQLL